MARSDERCGHCGDTHASDLACYRNKGRRRASDERAAAPVIDVSAAYEGTPNITMPSSECNRVSNERAADCPGCRYGVCPRHERAAVRHEYRFEHGAVHEIPTKDVIAALAAQGLYVVSDADMRVLDAMAAFPERDLRLYANEATWNEGNCWTEPARAELARREGKR